MGETRRLESTCPAAPGSAGRPVSGSFPPEEVTGSRARPRGPIDIDLLELAAARPAAREEREEEEDRTPVASEAVFGAVDLDFAPVVASDPDETSRLRAIRAEDVDLDDDDASIHEEITRVLDGSELALVDPESEEDIGARISEIRALYAKVLTVGSTPPHGDEPTIAAHDMSELASASESDVDDLAWPSDDYPEASVIAEVGPVVEVPYRALGIVADEGDEREVPAVSSVPPLPGRINALTLTQRQGLPRVVASASMVASLPIDHRAGFLLAHVDGVHTVDELLDMCGMPPNDALQLLGMLEQLGVIVLE